MRSVRVAGSGGGDVRNARRPCAVGAARTLRSTRTSRRMAGHYRKLGMDVGIGAVLRVQGPELVPA